MISGQRCEEIIQSLRDLSVVDLQALLEDPEVAADEFTAREIRDELLERRKIDVPFAVDDGGRRAAGFKGETGDCVTRAIAIATQIPYREVYEALAAGEAARGKARSARNGINRKVYDAYLEALGWRWTPTMHIGSGCTVHLRPDELPGGRIVCSLSGHLAAVVDGVVRDLSDPSRGGTRCVYGYWSAPDA